MAKSGDLTGSSPAQYHSRAAQVREYARTPDEIAAGEALRILQQPEQPLEGQLLHPDRRTLLLAGDEIQRGADTEGESAGRTARAQRLCEGFLLRRAHGEETEPEGLMLSMNFRHSSTAAGSLMNPIGGLWCCRFVETVFRGNLPRPARRCHRSSRCGRRARTTLASSCAVRSEPVQTGRRTPFSRRTRRAAKRLSMRMYSAARYCARKVGSS